MWVGEEGSAAWLYLCCVITALKIPGKQTKSSRVCQKLIVSQIKFGLGQHSYSLIDQILLRMLQNSRESGAINIDCVDPLGK